MSKFRNLVLFAWVPRLCFSCGHFLWFCHVWFVECGPNTTNAYCNPECMSLGDRSREDSWAVENGSKRY